MTDVVPLRVSILEQTNEGVVQHEGFIVTGKDQGPTFSSLDLKFPCGSSSDACTY